MTTDSERVVIVSSYLLQSLKKNLHGCDHAYAYISSYNTIYMLLIAEGNNFTIRENSCMVGMCQLLIMPIASQGSHG